MKILKYLCLVLIVAFFNTACYEEYVEDYDYTAAYFGSQKPLRTVVARNEMSITLGVTMGGRRVNNSEEWVKYRINEALLDSFPSLTLLPAAYYTLDNTEMFIIPKGSFIGEVKMTIDRNIFTSDPLAHTKHYALPLEIYETSLDSILSGEISETGDVVIEPKDYSIIAIKYISPYHGFYYHRGEQKTLDGSGNVTDTTTYWTKDLSQNEVWEMTTQALDTLITDGLGANMSLSAKLAVNGSEVKLVSNGSANIIESTGSYSEENNTIYLNYKYENGGTTYSVFDTLILRQDPEKDLRFEEW